VIKLIDGKTHRQGKVICALSGSTGNNYLMRPLKLSSTNKLAITVLNATNSLHRNKARQCVGNPYTIVTMRNEFNNLYLPFLSEGILLTVRILSENEMAEIGSRA
jgi:hypothetical protein